MNDTHFPVDSIIYSLEGYNDRGNHVVAEKSVSLSVNSNKWLAFLCSPKDLQELAIGFLFNENLISSIEEVADIYICDKQENIDVWLTREVKPPEDWRRTSGCSGGYTSAVVDRIDPVKENGFVLKPEQITNLIIQLYHSQEIYKQAGGIHSSALSDGSGRCRPA